jgi:hypothetical protein
LFEAPSLWDFVTAAHKLISLYKRRAVLRLTFPWRDVVKHPVPVSSSSLLSTSMETPCIPPLRLSKSMLMVWLYQECKPSTTSHQSKVALCLGTLWYDYTLT